jgi:hypothetical protein
MIGRDRQNHVDHHAAPRRIVPCPRAMGNRTAAKTNRNGLYVSRRTMMNGSTPNTTPVSVHIN